MKSIIMAVLTLFGCISTPQVYDPPTVLVSYHGVGAVQVWVSLNGGNPTRIGLVHSGLPACLNLPRNYGVMTLWVSEVGSKDVIKSPDFDNTYKHWVWSLSASLTTTRINLVPVDHSCHSRKTEART